mmetsp:Transcript_25017/g.22183  ORF Transcript_25017/g.22183 Transcript_25017/m.22183 type:complete len:114 (+) Transcript_25017:336-677(+)
MIYLLLKKKELPDVEKYARDIERNNEPKLNTNIPKDDSTFKKSYFTDDDLSGINFKFPKESSYPKIIVPEIKHVRKKTMDTQSANSILKNPGDESLRDSITKRKYRKQVRYMI